LTPPALGIRVVLAAAAVTALVIALRTHEGDRRGSLVAVSAAGGSVRWSVRTPSRRGAQTDALSRATGVVRWSKPLRATAGTANVGTAYVFEVDSAGGRVHLVALSLATGRTRWRRTLGLARNTLRQPNTTGRVVLAGVVAPDGRATVEAFDGREHRLHRRSRQDCRCQPGGLTRRGTATGKF
jgi:outer membrane protein assembly factor BamB